MTVKDNIKETCSDETVMYLDCAGGYTDLQIWDNDIELNISNLTLYYNYVRCNDRGDRLSERYMWPLCTVFANSCESIVI